MTKPRIGLAQLWQEVNTYSPRRTRIADFEELELTAGDELLDRHRGTQSVIAGFLCESSFDPVPVFSAAAWPAGPAEGTTADWLLDELQKRLAEAGPLDGLLLNLHGAMAYENRPDMELEALTTAREVIGDAPIGCVLDLHGIPSPAFVAQATIVIGYDTYPHVDMFARGREAAGLLASHLREGPLRSAVAKRPLLSTPLSQATDEEPMRGLLASASEFAREDGLTRVSLMPGFPYSDVERAGFSIVGVASADLGSELERTLDRIADEVESQAHMFAISRPEAAEAVRQARESPGTPVVIADLADNVGGGGAGDGTALLAELLEQRVEGALVTIADREVALQASEAGADGHIQALIGAKRDAFHGDPVEVEAKVRRITDGRYRSQGTYLTGQAFDMGTTAHLAVEGLDLVVTERAIPPFHSEQVTHLGINPANATVITVKGAVAWRAAFGEIAAEVIEADTLGVTPLHPDRLPRHTVPMDFSAAASVDMENERARPR